MAWRREPGLFDPDIGAQIELGFGVDGPHLAGLLRLRERIHAAANAFFARYEALLCPTAPVEAWPLGSLGPARIGGRPVGSRGHAAFTPLFNYANLAAVSLPCGVGARGLPVGLQIGGPRFADARVLQLAWHAERILGPSAPSPLLLE